MATEEVEVRPATAGELLDQATADFVRVQAARDALATKKKAAADELIALGVSKESAYLIANYFEEGMVQTEEVVSS